MGRCCRAVLVLPMLALMVGCTYLKPIDTQLTPQFPDPLDTVRTNSRNLIVFMDGTANDFESRTNVRILFETLSARGNPTNICFYVDGVGNKGSVLGAAFGGRMEARNKLAYEFLSRNYRENDRIFLFGFSRGAHEARTVAGLIAHCGLVVPDGLTRHQFEGKCSRAYKICRLTDEVTNEDVWENCMQSSQNPLAAQLASKGIKTRFATVEFVGVWDTVPGSSFKEFDTYAELPDRKPGTRYKLRPYPPIREIVHSVSLDERRNAFGVVLVGPPINPARTDVREKWFPGVHSDIGGGYEDATGLQGGSMNWMGEQFERYDLHPLPAAAHADAETPVDTQTHAVAMRSVFNAEQSPFPKVHEDAAGLAHNSVDAWEFDCFKRFLNYPVRRVVPNACISTNSESYDSGFHKSYADRLAAGDVPAEQFGKGPHTPLATLASGARLVRAPYATHATFEMPVGGVTNVTVVSADKWTFTDIGVLPGTEYWIRIEAMHELSDDRLAICPETGVMTNTVRQEFARPFLRVPDENYFALIACIGDDKSTARHVNSKQTFKPPVAGQLSLFFNDAFFAYGNNRGSARVRVERVEPTKQPQ